MMRFLFSILLVISFQLLHAQVKPASPAQDTMKTVEMIHADTYAFKKIDSVTELLTWVGKVVFKQEQTLFYCDSAVYNKNLRVIEAFGNVHINDHDSVNIYSQYLLYHVDTKLATLKNKVTLTDGKTTLTTEELAYDLNQKIGLYNTGGKVLSGKSVLTSKQGTYYADLKDVYFKQDVLLVDPAYTLRTDSLLYNTNTQLATFISLTNIVDSARRRIVTKEGTYDLKNRRSSLGGRSTIVDSAVFVTADKIETNDSTGINILTGNAVYKDTAQGVAILANRIEANRTESNFIATQHPLMIIKQESDSIYLTADTLFSGRLSKLLAQDSTLVTDTIRQTVVIDTKNSKNDSADRYFRAWYHVRIFSDSLQATSDSLFYSGKDSIFRLFKDPIVWASGNQVTGDTIYLYTKNKKADELHVFENGMAINKAGENMFNQVKGNRLFGYFKEGVIDYMRAKGSAESVYYVKDDNNALVGINKATGDIIDMRFKEKELKRVIFISDVKGTLFPVNQVSEQDKQLRNFKWLENKRPKTKFELFGE